MKSSLTILAALLFSPLAALHLNGTPTSDFDQKAATLFTKNYSFHAWNETDHTVDGEDWSLPLWVKPSPYTGIQMGSNLASTEFPGRIQRAVHASWREIEPAEGDFDFRGLRQEIVKNSENGKYAVKMGLGASVWETRYFQSMQDRTIKKTDTGTAPRWLKQHGIPLIEERPNKSIPFQVVNLDIYHPEYQQRYLKLIEAFGKSGIPQMKELDICYLHLVSASRGEEGSGPPVGDPKRALYEERLRAWADAFKGVTCKLCLVSDKEADMKLGLKLGMGQRNGFVEHYMLHAPNPGLGQELDAEGYLVVNEKSPLIAENRASGDENEEYTSGHVERFGPIETFPHRYHEATLRMLQMRRNFVWAEFGPWLINPPLLHYLALELGKTAQDAPDAWCYLRESVTKRGKQPVKNFERWLFQRDADGARTLATEKVEVPPQMFEFDTNHLYDLTARQTQMAKGQSLIRFGLDEAFLTGGPHAVAVKITYLDRANAEWQLEYFTDAQKTMTRQVTCGDSGAAKTITFILKDACFPGQGYTGLDLQIRALKGDAVIRFVRVIKLNPQAVKP